MPSTKSKGVSKVVRVPVSSSLPYTRIAQPQSAVQNQSAIARDRQKRLERMSQNMSGEHLMIQFYIPKLMFLLGLSSGSQNVIAELRGGDGGDDMVIDSPADVDVAPGDNSEMEWETLPDGLKDDETFIHALRDLRNSQFVFMSL